MTMQSKNDSAGDGLDLGQLMDQIRRDAEDRKRNSHENGAPAFYRQLILQNVGEALLFTPDAPLAPLKLQPELEERDHYHLNDLLGFHDEPFVRNAYRAILKREPDDTGLAHYLNNLRNGRYSKIDVLSSLRFSPEGENANVQIEGLGKLSALRKIYRVPVVGYFLRLAVGIARLPVLITNFRQLESHTMAQLDRVAGHINEAAAHLADEIREQSEASSTQFQALQQANELVRRQINSVLREQEKLIETQSAFRADLSLRVNQTTQQAQRQAEVVERHTAELQGLNTEIEKQIDQLTERLQKFRMDIAQQETRLSRLLDGNDRSLAPAVPSGETRQEKDHLLDSLYFSLEDVLRGTPEQIKEAVKSYLPILQRAGIQSDILDVGCGRGEWLEVLRDAGLQARGIDTNRILVQRCQDLSLDVVESDALTYLESLPDGKLNVITAFHFAEHLPLETLVRFLDEAARTLKPGGLIILETPNPENLLVGSCNFYLDPTHNNPIPIQTMKLLVEARGFRCEEVLKLHAISSPRIEVKDQLTSHFNHYLYGPMNYAVVARKPDLQ